MLPLMQGWFLGINTVNMSNKLQIPHPFTTVSDAVAVHLEHFKESCPHDFDYQRAKRGGLECFYLRLAPVMTRGWPKKQLDLGYIRLRRLDKNLTEFVIEDSKELDAGHSLYLGVRMRFWDEEHDDDEISPKQLKKLAIARFKRFEVRHQGARETVMQGLKDDHLLLADSKTTEVRSSNPAYVDKSRIAQLRQIPSTTFDLRRLIRVCEELNKSFASGSFCATAYLVRAILDHVPPIFGVGTFAEVANNIGSKSTKASLLHLERSSRNIADSLLHQQIRQREVVPTATQVDFKNDLDVLLGEIVRRLG